MPSRKRPKRSANESRGSANHTDTASPDDPIARFASALKASEERERAQQEREREQREAAEAAAAAARERADALDTARVELERAIERARTARRSGSGVPAADEEWRVAKARVIELETGAPPPWERHDDPS